MKNNRLTELDSIRGLSILVVMIYHYTTGYYNKYPQDFQAIFTFYEGKYGVQAFFIVSGFVIFMSLSRIDKPIDFIIHRLIRLYPTFWVSVLFTFIVVEIFTLPGRDISIYDMIINLSMVPSIFGVSFVDGVYWTLLYELKFYFIMLVLFMLNYLKYIDIIGLYFLLLVLLLNLLQINDLLIYKVVAKIFIFDYMHFFISGIMFYKIYNNSANYISYATLGLSLIVGLYLDEFTTTSTLILIYIVFILLSLHKLKWITIKPLTYLGSISYALYLIHQNLGYIIINYTYKINILPEIGMIIAMIVSIAIATLITYYVEKTSMQYLKQKYKINEYKIIDFLNSNNFLYIFVKDNKV